MTDVFISYKRKYRSEVDHLAARLKALGLTVWYDVGLSAGEQYRTEIKKALGAARVAIVCWTPECFADGDEGWVRWEAQFARNRGKLAPVFVRPTELEPPFHLDHVEDLSAWTQSNGHNGEDVWRRVLAALSEKLERPGLAELDAALAPARAAGAGLGLDTAAEEIKAQAARLSAEQRSALAASLTDWAGHFRKEKSAKRVTELAALAMPATATAAAAPAGLVSLISNEKTVVAGPQLDAKGKPLVLASPIKVISAVTYGLSMIRAAPQFVLSLGAVLLLFNLWSASELQEYALKAPEVLAIEDPAAQFAAMAPLYQQVALPLAVSMLFGWVLQTSFLRALVRGERVSGFLGLSLGADEVRVILANLGAVGVGMLTYLVAMIAGVMVGGVVGLLLGLAGFADLAGAAGAAVGSVIGAVIFGWIFARLTPIAAATVARRKIAWGEGWRLSKGAVWPILLATVLAFAPVMLFGLLLQLIGPQIGAVHKDVGVADLSSPLGYGLMIVQALISTPFLAAFYGVGAYVFIQRSTAAAPAEQS